ncbi:MAG: hypothetical protein ACKOZW_07500 [Cyanobium sp.]
MPIALALLALTWLVAAAPAGAQYSPVPPQRPARRLCDHADFRISHW